MIKIDMTSDAVDKQLLLLEEFPEIATRHYKPALQDAASIIESAIGARVPNRTGNLMEKLSSRVTGRKIEKLRAAIGYATKKDEDKTKLNYVWYAHLPEGGAKAHEIKSGKISKSRYEANRPGAKVLHWVGGTDGGEGQFAKHVNHPGTASIGFVQSGERAARISVDVLLSNASDAVVRDLSV